MDNNYVGLYMEKCVSCFSSQCKIWMQAIVFGNMYIFEYWNDLFKSINGWIQNSLLNKKAP